MRSLCLLILVFVLVSCDRHRNHPGWDYFPDMFYSTAYESYTENPNFDDGMTMRVPPEGAIPKDHVPFEYTLAEESRKRAGAELTNPFEPTGFNIQRGKESYEIFCIVCHGPTGAGDGTLAVSGLYPAKPRPIAGNGAAPLTDGEIYHTIILGFGSMGPHGSQVRPDDRWMIIHYIRDIQKSQK